MKNEVNRAFMAKKKLYLIPATQEQSVIMNTQVLQTVSPAGSVYIPMGSDIGGSEGNPIVIQ